MRTLLLALLLFAVVTPLTAQEPPAKKLIEWGRDESDSRFIRENIRKMEEMPFDGLIFHIGSSKDGKFTWEMWGDRRFEIEEFRHAVDDLKMTDFQQFTDRFLRVAVIFSGRPQ